MYSHRPPNVATGCKLYAWPDETTVISQPRPSWKVGLVTLVAETATTRVGNSIGARLYRARRIVEEYNRVWKGMSYEVDEAWLLRCRVNRQLSLSV